MIDPIIQIWSDGRGLSFVNFMKWGFTRLHSTLLEFVGLDKMYVVVFLASKLSSGLLYPLGGTCMVGGFGELFQKYLTRHANLDLDSTQQSKVAPKVYRNYVQAWLFPNCTLKIKDIVFLGVATCPSCFFWRTWEQYYIPFWIIRRFNYFIFFFASIFWLGFEWFGSN